MAKLLSLHHTRHLLNINRIEFSNLAISKMLTKVHQDEQTPLSNRVFIEQSMGRLLRKSSGFRSVAFLHLNSFHNKLLKLEQLCKERPKPTYQCNNKVLSCMLPLDNMKAVPNAHYLHEILTQNQCSNIVVSNPYKDIETIHLSSRKGVTRMVVNCFEEILKIKKYHPSAEYVWQIENPDIFEAKVMFELLKKYDIKLNGLKFVYEQETNPDLVRDITNAFRSAGHSAKNIDLQVDINAFSDKHQIGKLKSFLAKVNEKHIKLEIRGLDTTSMISYAARVIGKRAQYLYLNEEIDCYLSDYDRKRFGNMDVSVGEWIVFTPKNTFRMQEVTNRIIEMPPGQDYVETNVKPLLV